MLFGALRRPLTLLLLALRRRGRRLLLALLAATGSVARPLGGACLRRLRLLVLTNGRRAVVVASVLS